MKALTHEPAPRAPRGGTVGPLLITGGLLALLALAAIHGGIWWQRRLPDVLPGDVAPVTIITPVKLTVEDARSTARLREQEGRRIRPVFEFDSQASERVANRFLEKYDSTQIQFIRSLKKNWELPLLNDQLESVDFINFVTAFRISHPNFPLSDDLAGHWAGDAPGDPVRRETAYQIREQQRQYITPDEPPPEATTNHADYWMLTKGEHSTPPTLGEIRKAAHLLPSKSTRSISAAREGLVQALNGFENDWLQFAVTFLEPNLFFDENLTAATRREATTALIVYKDLNVGDAVIEIGTPVTQPQAEALLELGRHYATNSPKGIANGWLLGLGIGCVVLGNVIRRAGRRADLSALVSTGDINQHHTAAEIARLRGGLVNQMSRWLKEQFVIRLIDQRNEAIHNQAGASSKVDQINTRLNKLQPEIQKRIAGYEKRIAALERELGESNAMNKELILTRIKMAKKELEIEKAKSNLAWN